MLDKNKSVVAGWLDIATIIIWLLALSPIENPKQRTTCLHVCECKGE
jgi:hypothetical protein